MPSGGPAVPSSPVNRALVSCKPQGDACIGIARKAVGGETWVLRCQSVNGNCPEDAQTCFDQMKATLDARVNTCKDQKPSDNKAVDSRCECMKTLCGNDKLSADQHATWGETSLAGYCSERMSEVCAGKLKEALACVAKKDPIPPKWFKDGIDRWVDAAQYPGELDKLELDFGACDSVCEGSSGCLDGIKQAKLDRAREIRGRFAQAFDVSRAGGKPGEVESVAHCLAGRDIPSQYFKKPYKPEQFFISECRDKCNQPFPPSEYQLQLACHKLVEQYAGDYDHDSRTDGPYLRRAKEEESKDARLSPADRQFIRRASDENKDFYSMQAWKRIEAMDPTARKAAAEAYFRAEAEKYKAYLGSPGYTYKPGRGSKDWTGEMIDRCRDFYNAYGEQIRAQGEDSKTLCTSIYDPSRIKLKGKR